MEHLAEDQLAYIGSDNYHKLTKKDRKEQRKIQNYNKKILLKFLDKNYMMYNSEWFVEASKMVVKAFYEYWKDGKNVWSADVRKQFDSLYKLMGIIEKMDKAKDGATKEDYEKYQELLVEFFTEIGKNIDLWWD